MKLAGARDPLVERGEDEAGVTVPVTVTVTVPVPYPVVLVQSTGSHSTVAVDAGCGRPCNEHRAMIQG